MMSKMDVSKSSNPVTYVGYIRVSTDDQKSGEDVQRAEIMRYGNVVEVFVDRISGKTKSINRDGLTKALNLCREKGHTLLFYKLDRLSRNIADGFAIKESGVELKCITMPELNTITFGVSLLFAQTEREAISSRTKEALAIKKAQGVKLGNPRWHDALFRYARPVMLYNSKKQAYDFHHKNAMFAKRMKEKEGKTLKQIADIFTELDIRNQDSKPYTIFQISRIIRKFTGEPPRMPITPVRLDTDNPKPFTGKNVFVKSVKNKSFS